MSVSPESVKLQLQRLEEDITRCSASDRLCDRCRPVGDQILHIISHPDEFCPASRYGVGNTYIGTVSDVLSEYHECTLCGLMAVAAIRLRRREIFNQIRARNHGIEPNTLNADIVPNILRNRMGLDLDDDGAFGIFEAGSDEIQVAVSPLPREGAIMAWLPLDLADDVDDNGLQIFMTRDDFKTTFGEVDEAQVMPYPFLEKRRDLARFRRCLDSCCRDHSNCKVSPKTGMPSRLLDIQHMKIVKTADIGDVEYIALSYVWGIQPFLILVQANWDALSTAGGLEKATENLPRTIVDAIEITRALGFRFLWVDSLCIMQDQLADKMDEIQRMHLIYSRAELTIVAATGDSAQAPAIYIDPGFLTDSYQTICGRQFTLDRPELRNVVEFSTWFSRGWTLQELLCSRRLLYFTPERTYYTCSQGNWSEDFPFVGTKDPSDEATAARVSPDDVPQTWFNFSEEGGKAYGNYVIFVEKMSERNFTRNEDILNASLGFYTTYLVEELGTSVSGLPATYLEASMMWQPRGRLKQRGLGPFGGPLPTWSWSGWVGQVHYPFFDTINLDLKCMVDWTLLVPCPTKDQNSPKQELRVARIKCADAQPDAQADRSSWLEARVPPCILEWKSNEQILVLQCRAEPPGSSETETETETSPIIQSAILTTTTRTCSLPVQEVQAPDLPAWNGLRFFGVSSPGGDSLMGEVKSDGGSIAEFFADGRVPEVAELVAIATLDFNSDQFREGIMFLNEYSRVGQFSNIFTKSLEQMSNQDMAIVLWICRRGGLAYRLGLGYVKLDEFRNWAGTEERLFLG